MGRKSNHLMERVYAHLSKNGCLMSGLLADPELTDTLLNNQLINQSHPKVFVCKTNTLPILMHQMRISTNKVSSVMLRPKKLEIRNKNV
jgi:hypothetical protein